MGILTKEYHKKFFGAQDAEFSKHPEYYTYASDLIKNSNNTLKYSKIKCDVYEEKYWVIMTLKITEYNIYFNMLELKIYNPQKKNFDKIFDYINFEVSCQEFYRIYDSTYINMYNQVFKTNREIRYEDEYTFIPLPFIPKEALLYSLEYHSITIKCRKNYDHQFKPELYGNTYKIKESEKSEKSEMIIYQWQYTGDESVRPSLNHKIRLNFNHPVYLMYIAGDFDQNNVEKYVLKFNGEKVLEITHEALNKKNNELGYKFEYPTFVFSDIFEGYSNSTINFSGIDKASVSVYHKSVSECIIYKIFAMSLQSIIISDGMAGLRFSK